MAEGSAPCPPRSLSISSSPPSPLAPPNIVYAYFKCHPPCAALFFFFSQSTPPCHRVSAAITFSITSQWEVKFPGGYLSEPITAGGQAEVKWHDLWVGWSRRGGGGGGGKCIANLWNIWIKAWELGPGHTMWRHGKREVTESTEAERTIVRKHFHCSNGERFLSVNLIWKKEYFSFFFLTTATGPFYELIQMSGLTLSFAFFYLLHP